RVPQRQVVATRGRQANVGAEAPDGFQVAQRLPFEQPAGVGVPAPEDPRLFDGPEAALRTERQRQQVAIGVKLWIAEHLGSRQGRGSKGGRSHGVLQRLGSRVRPRVPRRMKILQQKTARGTAWGTNLKKSPPRSRMRLGAIGTLVPTRDVTR